MLLRINERTSTLLIGSVNPSPRQFVRFRCSQSPSSPLRVAITTYSNDCLAEYGQDVAVESDLTGEISEFLFGLNVTYIDRYVSR
jgi:hypothetical protein